MKPCNAVLAATATFALAFAVPALAAQPGAAPQTQAAMDAGSGTNLQAADQELNKVYQQVLKKYADYPGFIAKFKAAQRAWLAFRDAEIAARFPAKDPATEYGTSYPMCLADIKTRLTMERTKALRVWLAGVQEGDVCAGAVRAAGN